MDITVLTPEQLMAQAIEGRLTKDELAGLLAVDRRRAFLSACADVERGFTEACANNGPCLEAGCSAAGEICLQPLLHAGSEYHKACAAAWLPIYREPANRAGA
jgi:hypothetical protein